MSLHNIFYPTHGVHRISMNWSHQDFKYRLVPPEIDEFNHSDTGPASSRKNFMAARAIGNGIAIANGNGIANPQRIRDRDSARIVVVIIILIN